MRDPSERFNLPQFHEQDKACGTVDQYDDASPSPGELTSLQNSGHQMMAAAVDAAIVHYHQSPEAGLLASHHATGRE